MDGAHFINYIEDSRRYMTNVREEWKKFIESGTTSGLVVRDEVLNSWKASVANGLSTDGTGAALVLDEKTMSKLNQKSRLLLNAAEPVMDEFANMLEKRGANESVINLCNEDTVILRTATCGSEGENYAKNQRILPGAILDEKHTGTTGVSLARATKLPYALYGPEHFRQQAKACCCAAAPITNIRTKQISGIIAWSGETFDIVPDTIGVITFLARTIESNLLATYLQNDEALMQGYRKLLRRGAADLFVVVDADLNVLASSANTHPLISGILPARKLDKSVSACIRRRNELYLCASKERDFGDTDAEDSGQYRIEFQPIYRGGVYIGVVLSIRDLALLGVGTGSSVGQAARPQIQLVGKNPAFRAEIDLACSAAPTDAPIMLLGETGTGKEVFAKMICKNSKRADRPFIAINCGALPRELIGSELFGYAAGAFTGASQKGNAGKLEAANTGTIFLDELGSMPLDAQAYLLRAIEENELFRLGSTKAIPIDVRFICAANENLSDLIEARQFRADLYYRLNVVEINIPPLRERMEDLSELIEHFNTLYSGEACEITREELAFLKQYSWPGNVRELKNVLHGASVLNADPISALKKYVSVHLKSTVPAFSAQSKPALRTVGAHELDSALEACGGNIAKASRQLGVARSTFYRRMRREMAQPASLDE